VALQTGADVVHAIGGQRRGARRQASRHPYDRTALAIYNLQLVDQTADLGQLGREPRRLPGDRLHHLHVQRRYPFVPDDERHVGVVAAGQHQAGDLTECGGYPNFVL
jgi:hypothetical protein